MLRNIEPWNFLMTSLYDFPGRYQFGGDWIQCHISPLDTTYAVRGLLAEQVQAGQTGRSHMPADVRGVPCTGQLDRAERLLQSQPTHVRPMNHRPRSDTLVRHQNVSVYSSSGDLSSR